MRKTVLITLGALLIIGLTRQAAAANDGRTRKARRAQLVAGQQFRNANNGVQGGMKNYCQNHEPGNPYDKQADYMGWSAWRQHGGWDSRNDCW